ncbi:MAG: hypothetical protein J6Z38_01610, partial [Lachnospiraceae bacterium]|nr:hypothetical protein [Lachnospiraceae bacterium]
EGRQPVLAAGFNTAEEAFYLQEFRDLGLTCSDRKKQDALLQDPLHQGTFMDVRIATLDGSLGVKGFVTDALPADYTYFYCCGPMPMLKAVYKATKTSGQFSLEERMGCGFGACMGCSIETANGPKRVCKDGPVFLKEELPWELR